MGKEEIACYQFLLFQWCFQKACTADMYMFGKRVNFAVKTKKIGFGFEKLEQMREK